MSKDRSLENLALIWLGKRKVRGLDYIKIYGVLSSTAVAIFEMFFGISPVITFLNVHSSRTWNDTYQSVNISFTRGEIPLSDEMAPVTLPSDGVILFRCLQRWDLDGIVKMVVNVTEKYFTLTFLHKLLYMVSKSCMKTWHDKFTTIPAER
jgi:hypothetical protein